jgi:adenylyltransferase/sulfurtransferase
MQDDSLRYSCQLALPGFGEVAQEKLQQAKVLIVGVGGLGCPVAQYLTASGIGTIGLADYDVVSISNLHRQILYTPQEVGQKKAEVACFKLHQQNPQVSFRIHDTMIDSSNVMETISQYDIVVDCTDNIETKYLLNDACVLSGKPLVYGAIYQYEGQVAVWNVNNSPNYRDLYPSIDATQVPNCAEGGVLPTLAGIIGCMQANEVIKYITNSGELLTGKLMTFDAQTMQSRIIKLGYATKTNITSLEQPIQIPTISITELQADLNKYDLIDVRNPEEHSEYNIGGRNIPLAEIGSFAPSGKPVVFYCSSGKRSAEAAKLILKNNPTLYILSLSGGLQSGQEQLA